MCTVAACTTLLSDFLIFMCGKHCTLFSVKHTVVLIADGAPQKNQVANWAALACGYYGDSSSCSKTHVADFLQLALEVLPQQHFSVNAKCEHNLSHDNWKHALGNIVQAAERARGCTEIIPHNPILVCRLKPSKSKLLPSGLHLWLDHLVCC